MLFHIHSTLETLLPTFNNRKPAVFSEVVRKELHASFVRAGQSKKIPTTSPRRGLLDYANDWKIQVDFTNKNVVFPPSICSTDQRPDVVLWSRLSRVVILLELTCPAEEGIPAAEVRKTCRYEDLVRQINEKNTWKAQLFTLEVGARGLVSSKTFHAFRRLGLTAPKQKHS